MAILDRIFGCLLILGGLGHAFGSFHAYGNNPMSLLWALCASLFGFLLAAVNLLRAGRRHDPALAWISFFGCLAWAAFVVWFGAIIGSFADFRVLINLIVTLALAAFSVRSALRSSRA